MNLKIVKCTKEVIETKYELPVYLYFQDEWCNDELVMITDKNKTTVKCGINVFTIEITEDCAIGDINLETAITTKEHFEEILNEVLNYLLSYKTINSDEDKKNPMDFAFAEWLGTNYIRLGDAWVHKFANQTCKENWLTTEHLYVYYNNFCK